MWCVFMVVILMDTQVLKMNAQEICSWEYLWYWLEHFSYYQYDSSHICSYSAMSKIMDNEFPTSWNRSQNFALHGTTLIVAYYPSYSPGQAQVGHFHVQRWAASIPSDPTMSPSRGVQMPKSNNTRVALSVPLHHNYVQRGPMSPALPVQSIVASGFLMLQF